MTKRKNKALKRAKNAKNDEFYTLLSNVEKELKYYAHHFKGKVVLCNTDDPARSNFWKYFHDRFTDLGLKRLIAVHYVDAPGEVAYRADYDGLTVTRTPLVGNGDFRSEEALNILDACDIVVTNPPFSLFRVFLEQLITYEKDFLIIGGGMAGSYQRVFEQIRLGRVRIGLTGNGGTKYIAPDGSIKGVYTDWYTTLTPSKTRGPLPLTATYTPEAYPVYDDYDAISVNRLKDIPMDYDGPMGVPITVIRKHDPSQFRLIKSLNPNVNGKEIFRRIIIQRIP